MAKRKIVLSKSFIKAYKKFVARNAILKKQIDLTIVEMESDLNNSSLKTHKLSGILIGSFACSCGNDCRIIFEINKNVKPEEIILIDLGTHNEVY
jgi:mRNA-degrading endonuclease YafQ of YafQ-DinJ toxin-antitoxin module